MKRFKNILAVYADGPGGDDVLVQAVGLARDNGARLTILNPREHPRPFGTVEEVRRRLPKLVPWVSSEGVSDVVTDVVVGTPYVEIIRKVAQDDHDLVIVSAEDGRVLKDVFLGNTATNLLLKCPGAVWVQKPGQRQVANGPG